jgi:FAD:protein FMN transferase
MTSSPRRRPAAGLLALALSLVAPAASAQTKAAPKYELAVNFEIAPHDEPRYRRPYVVVWIEDKEGRTVRTLNLWVQTVRRGPRWIPNLKRWYRNLVDVGRSDTDAQLEESYTGATRQPGKYTVVWDGLDDKGKPVKPGEYSVCIEAAREHGTYGFIRKAYKIGTKPFKDALEGNEEIKEASVEFRKRA